MGAEAKSYLQKHSIPELFEGLMTGLIYNKPENPLAFLEEALAKVRRNPDLALKWDSFVDSSMPPAAFNGVPPSDAAEPPRKSRSRRGTETAATATSVEEKKNTKSVSPGRASSTEPQRLSSASKAAAVAQINTDAPIILFMGGPGGGKTRYAARVRDAFESRGLTHICAPDLIKEAIKRYRDRYPEWKEASRRYERGELIPNELVQQLVKAEMGRNPRASAYLLEGFPRDAAQVETFEKNVRPVNMAIILDFDETTLRRHMSGRGLNPEVIDRRINEFREKTLPSAKYFDDHRLLHLIPGEKDDETIFERVRKLVSRAMESGVPIRSPTPIQSLNEDKPNESAIETKQEDNQMVESERGTAEIIPGTSDALASTERTIKAIGSAIGGSIQRSNGTPNSTKTTTDREMEKPTERTVESSKADRTEDRREQRTAERNSVVSSASNAANSNAGISTKPENPQTPANRNITSNGTLGETTAEQRPKTEETNQSITQTPQNISIPNSRDSQNQSEKAEESRPPTDRNIQNINSPKAENPRTASAEGNQMAGSGAASRIPTAADRFPRGLPNNAPVVLIIGAPGSNKTTVADMVTQKYEGFTHLSMGALLRKKVSQNPDDELWIRVGKKMAAGEHIPMKICRDVLYSAIHEMGAHSWGYVIEGYPRTLAQADDLESQLGRLDVAVLLDCTEQFCKSNIRKRFEEQTDREIIERSDDDENPAKQRLSLFKQNTLPMLKHLDDRGKLRVVRRKIEGDNGAEKMFEDVSKNLDAVLFVDRENRPN